MKDWLRIFLPIWALGTMAWITTGLILLPEAFRRPLLYSSSAAWTSTLYDLTSLDMEVARALTIVLGPPALAVVIAMLVVAVEQFCGKRGPGKR